MKWTTKSLNDRSKWHRWFAYWPVVVEEVEENNYTIKKWAWLESVGRRLEYKMTTWHGFAAGMPRKVFIPLYRRLEDTCLGSSD